ncbi:MlaE family lipid ABC transporter permease subunit [Candidatus Endoriftia persephonae]|jgi:phospholipid/cholesterol/gamma-HCH transport system permease protein|uniref:MlaE family lipid ABC transporter permease subunit n=4 Tax=Gammaproteobacteria TaxID=1236 RepID=A0A9J6ZVG1_9GAMM|nr:MlaE family lipid ABC transporter permease subunit [Candidatus Endoriftia persephone]EGV51592.1 putative ABC transporter permease [endosymbiont of Riftia pachyptila (vent Ph05)]EGW55617.1 putative ABC transporter permease protein [endosymbiont of Tevnia jerichonana (vent Tica)]KRT54633.1 ABC transport permease subunit [endosymbiont of Ridgeia piscesae]KRT59921.1 phospholipid/cholesterol/gamma-HCH transport system permease protein [endosymbiont of Ridgeia piscesae]USF86761.1 MlaE family lipi
MIKYLNHLGEVSLDLLDQAGRMAKMLLSALLSLFRAPYQLEPVIRQLHFIGARSMLVIVISGLFTGMVLALQFHNTLERFGSVDLLGSAVALALLRELGPVMAALMVVGRAGSAMCAEIGIMRTSEQIDALECMAIDPHKFIIAPKLVAGIISLPLLTSVFDVMGLIGGWLVGVQIFGLNQGAYFDSMYSGVEWNDVAMGLYKSLLFGLVITVIATAKGFFMHLERGGRFGAEGVSQVTTSAVVVSAIAILFGDYLVGALML